MSVGLYVHIPFCHARCHYCDFATFTGKESQIPRYLEALSAEMTLAGRHSINTLFFGGGTPSVLESGQWEKLFGDLRRHFDLSRLAEATVECNPESTTPEKLRTLRALGVNRLSFGLQSTHDVLLKKLNRLHTFRDFLKVYQDARAAGFDNINIDLMFGLPGQTAAQWTETLGQVIGLAPQHLSAYGLSVEEDAAFGRMGLKADEDLEADMYEIAAEKMGAAGFIHYEISNFARPGRECRHNLKYWKNHDCLAVGLSGAGYFQGARHKNREDLEGYMSDLAAGRPPTEDTERLAGAQALAERVILALRLREGVVLTPKEAPLFARVLERFVHKGFLTQSFEFHSYHPTLLGWRLSNLMFVEILEAAAPAISVPAVA